MKINTTISAHLSVTGATEDEVEVVTSAKSSRLPTRAGASTVPDTTRARDTKRPPDTDGNIKTTEAVTDTRTSSPKTGHEVTKGVIPFTECYTNIKATHMCIYLK